MKIEIQYAPKEHQRRIHKSLMRWNVIVAHRRFGKTVMAINEGQKQVLLCKKKNPRVGYIAPTYKMAKNISWDYLKQYAKGIPGIKINESELRIDYPNKGRFQLFGADNPDSLRGLYFDFIIFDEYSQQPSNIFTEIILPSLTDRKGGALWIGTPQGKNEFYRLFHENQDKADWYCEVLRASETNVINKEDLEATRLLMDPDEYNQEFECSWVASIKGAYYGYEIENATREGRITNVPYDAAMHVHTVWDLGISDDMAIGFYQMQGREPRMIDFYSASGHGLDHYIELLKQKGYSYGRHIAPHDIQVRELSSGKSRKEIARELGIHFEVAPNIGVDDGINAGRMMLKRLWIDKEKCSFFLDALIQYHRAWNEKKGCFENRPLHDWTSHAADVHRYFSVAENLLTSEGRKAKQFIPKKNAYAYRR